MEIELFPMVHMDVNEVRLGLRALRHLVDGIVHYVRRSTAWMFLNIERLDKWSFQ